MAVHRQKRHIARVTFTLRLDADRRILRPLLTPPAANTHKYKRGHAMVFSGPPLRTGASRLAARAALAVGAGLVTIVGERDALAEQVAHVTAIMLREIDAELSAIDERVRAMAVGPGAGVSDALRELVIQLLGKRIPIVIDADAITVFEDGTEHLFNGLHPHSVMTPHEGEFTRLFPDIKLDDRVAAAIEAGCRSGAVLLLKGPQTIIAAPDSEFALNDHASPWLASAGSGDILTGLVCGLLAQGLPAFDSACIAAWLHGDIGRRFGPGLTADDMPAQIPLVLQGCLAESAEHGAGSRT